MNHNFTCPYCWEDVDVQLEFSVSETYIQDCEVCCNPIEIQTEWSRDVLTYFNVNPIGQ